MFSTSDLYIYDAAAAVLLTSAAQRRKDLLSQKFRWAAALGSADIKIGPVARNSGLDILTPASTRSP